MEKQQTINVFTIKLEKEENIKGETWFRVYINDSCERSFIADETDSAEIESNKLYDDIVDRIKNGYPKVTVIRTDTEQIKDGSNEASIG